MSDRSWWARVASWFRWWRIAPPIPSAPSSPTPALIGGGTSASSNDVEEEVEVEVQEVDVPFEELELLDEAELFVEAQTSDPAIPLGLEQQVHDSVGAVATARRRRIDPQATRRFVSVELLEACRDGGGNRTRRRRISHIATALESCDDEQLSASEPKRSAP
jgi:hypothetical protein